MLRKTCPICKGRKWKCEDTRRRCVRCDARRSKSYNAKLDVQSKMLRSARTRARRRGLPCTITAHDIVVSARCPVLGITLAVSVTGSPTDASPTLDRLDSFMGYVPGNVIVISHRANRLKGDGTAGEHLQIAQFIQSRRT